MHAIVSAAVTAALALPLSAAAQDGPCRHDADIEGTLAIGTATSVWVFSQAGSLRVEGRSGLDRVRVTGVACASDEGYLDDLRVDIAIRDGQVQVEALYPEIRNRGDRTYARIDLVVEIPVGMDTDIRDGSGTLQVNDVGAVRIHDGSGNLTVSGAVGAVEIRDGSGGLVVRDVIGDVDLKDGSGNIEVFNVEGSVVLTDGSGAIRGEDVTGDFIVESDGSGGIVVDGIGGDFRVLSTRNGGIRYTAVDGEIEVPEERRKRRRNR